MQNKLVAFLVFVSIFNASHKAQSGGAYEMCKLILTSEDSSGNKFSAGTNKCYMVLNLTSGDFLLRADLSTLKSNDAKTDSLLIAGKEQTLVFKGNINQNILEYNKNQNDEKLYDMTGILSLNGASLTATAQFDPINLADKSDPKNYRMDFLLSIETAKMKIKGWEDKLFKSFVFEAMGGKLNIQN
ncbi:MAG: hypothetical protein WCR21_01885 [Bacteroidota bacterium]